ncbi:MAG: hypothetical protein P9M03_10000, partial [Candidatus Theseobacter exili]|nr:hypothetical protein [Candidatus Theseobacter exili]
VEEAKKRLMDAGRTPGSPQLKTFGPNMILAKDFLEQGEDEVVLQYFDRCKRFWWSIFSFFKIRKWKKLVRKGLMPDFGSHMNY